MTPLIEDLSGKDRIDRNISEFLASNEYCYVPNYPCKYFDTSDLGAKTWTSNLDDINKIINLDYQLVTTLDPKLQRFVVNIVDVIQSIDQWGIKAALCLYTPITAHPGNKRLIVSRYLGKSTVPVIGLKKFFVDSSLQMSKIKTINDLYQIFGKEISINIRRDYEDNCLEVFYHGESHMRDKNGMDNFAKKASLIRYQNKICPNISDYLLQNGLEIVSRFNKINKTGKNRYKTFYSSNLQINFT